MDDEDVIKPASSFVIGQDLSLLSVEELDENIELMKNEIERLQHARSEKAAHLSEAEALFSKN